MITLCLYNTYDKKKLHDIHLRSVARAAPVCHACGMALALVDFPQKMGGIVEESTTIGEHGKYLACLKDENRFFELHRRFPLGILVATTCRPEGKKSIPSPQLLILATGKDVVLVMGLGRRGLPKAVRNKAHHHWDVTGKGISLETCAAMGFIGGVLFEARSSENKKRKINKNHAHEGL